MFWVVESFCIWRQAKSIIYINHIWTLEAKELSAIQFTITVTKNFSIFASGKQQKILCSTVMNIKSDNKATNHLRYIKSSWQNNLFSNLYWISYLFKRRMKHKKFLIKLRIKMAFNYKSSCKNGFFVRKSF